MSHLHQTVLRIAVPVLCVCAALIGSAHGQAGKSASKWTPETVMQLKKVGGVQVSPDSKRVVYVITTAVMDGDSSEYLSHIHLANADGTDALQLTQGDKSCDGPQWSPDGKWIAFMSARSGKRNIWMIRARGGEAEKLTDVKTGVTSFKWSPDGTAIAFTAADAQTAAEEKAAKMKNDARVVDQNVKMVHLHAIAVEKNADGKRTAKQLTSGDFSVGSALGGGSFDWSPDGKIIAYTRTNSPAVDHWPSADIWLVTVSDLKTKPLIATSAAEMSPMFSPDGNWIACVVSDSPASWPRKARVHAIGVKGGKTRILAATHDESPNLVGWSHDSSKVFYTEAFHTMTRLDALPLDGKAPAPTSLAQGVITDVNLNATRTSFGLTRQSLIHPPEAYVSEAANFNPARITNVNEKLANVPLGKTELVNWKAKDGLNIEGLLTYPVGFQKDKQYPLLLVIHGGPAGVYSQSFIGNAYPYPVAALAAEGYLVLRCNPRGSTGYGAKFRYANVKDWGGADYQDLMAGVDHVLKMGIADEKKMGVMGWSYGGFMTSWTITQTKRFKAASVGAGVTNLASFTGTADIPSFLPSYFGGEFWNHPGLYEKHSAMWQVKNVVTPTLIQHGDKDDRVPISQGYELYNALKRQGVTTQMVVYPRTPHSPSEPRLLQDVMQRNVDWMAKYVK
ncbi:MAG TPA: S9 family peptidase [Gemmataceae bacterium]|nr:S9 family peptidase [Gemmataceae bacterium]